MTREYDELPDVDETVLPRSLRVGIFTARRRDQGTHSR